MSVFTRTTKVGRGKIHPGATALILALEFNLTISFFTPRTRPYCKPAFPEAYSVCPACPNFPVSDPVTTMDTFSISVPVLSWLSSTDNRKCLMVKKVPRILLL